MNSANLVKQTQRRSSGAIKHRRNQLPWPDGKDFRILSIDGGGIRGIFPAAFLAGLEDRYLDGGSITQHFDLIAGTSTGGIIALGLGAGLASSELRDLYICRGCEIFPPLPSWVQGVTRTLQAFRYRYKRDALMNVLRDSFGDQTFGASKIRLCVPSCDGQYGEVYIFKTPHHPDYRKDRIEKMTKVAAATSAAPSFFKPLEDGGFTFIDGGIWCNNPIMVGLVDALACYSVAPNHIRILSIGCGADPYKISKSQKMLGGLLFWRNIIFAAMRFQSMNALGQAGLLIGANRIVRVDPPMTNKPIQMDDWKRASGELPTTAVEKLEEYGETIASIFLQEPASPYTPIPVEATNQHPVF